MNLLKELFTNNLTIKTFLQSVFGVALIGMGSGIFRFVEWGVDPCSCTVNGISAVTGIQFGTVQLLYNCVLFIFVLLLYIRSIGLGTIINMAGVGYISDFTLWIVSDVLKVSPNAPVKVILVAVFLVVFSFGIAMYMEAEIGTAPYDTFGEIISKATDNRIPFHIARVIIDVIHVLAGILLGTVIMKKKVFGICTIILALCVGFIVGWFRKLIRKKKEKVKA